jgi:hypothetical protein
MSLHSVMRAKRARRHTRLMRANGKLIRNFLQHRSKGEEAKARGLGLELAHRGIILDQHHNLMVSEVKRALTNQGQRYVPVSQRMF